MVLNLPGIPKFKRIKGLFTHSERYQQGIGTDGERPAIEEIIVDVAGGGDFSNIQEAIDSLPAAGGAIKLRQGTYNITSKITITAGNVSIRGTGNATIIQTTASDPFIQITGSNVILEYIKFVGNQSSNQKIDISSGSNVTIRNCWIFQSQIGIQTEAGVGIIENNLIEDCSGNGISLGGTIVASDNNFVKANEIKDCGQSGIRMTNTDRSIVTGNYSHDNGIYGIDNSNGLNTNNIITNNVVINNTTSQINDGGVGTIVANNQVT